MNKKIKKIYLKIRPIIVLLPLIHLLLFPTFLIFHILNGPDLNALEGARCIVIGILGSGIPAFILLFLNNILDSLILKKNKKA